jgi:hypothetical protein
VVAAGDLLKVQPRGISQVMIVASANVHHRFPVILVNAEDQGKNGDENYG